MTVVYYQPKILQIDGVHLTCETTLTENHKYLKYIKHKVNIILSKNNLK